jgi:hypothetical protein
MVWNRRPAKGVFKKLQEHLQTTTAAEEQLLRLMNFSRVLLYFGTNEFEKEISSFFFVASMLMSVHDFKKKVQPSFM